MDRSARVEGAPPIRVDYRKLAPDVCPYVSRFGEVAGEAKLKLAVKNAADIRDYCLHMYQTAKTAFAGTVCADTFLIYHDALQQYTDKDCVLFLKNEGIFKYFILPVMGCNDGTAFANRMIGNSPELNNLDSSLFADLIFLIQRHCAATRKLPINDARRFSLATPKLIQEVVKRLWTNDFITSERIIEDSDKIYNSSIPLILAHHGKVVENCSDRKGKRFSKIEVKNNNHGGRRVKGQSCKKKPMSYHFHAKEAVQEARRKSLERVHAARDANDDVHDELSFTGDEWPTIVLQGEDSNEEPDIFDPQEYNYEMEPIF